MSDRPSLSLRDQIRSIADEAGAEAVGVAFYDYAHGTSWSYEPDRWFHAASTIKVPILLGVYDAIEQGRLRSHELVHVRNRFVGAADGVPYSIDSGRDANSAVHREVGRVMRVFDLARHMIVTSSNLATNILIGLVGVEAIQATLERHDLGGLEVVRGVEDHAAWEAGINNRVTARGLLEAFRTLVEGDHFEEERRIEIIGILDDQKFRAGIPAGLPDTARVANKTGEISTIAHDAGIVYLPNREPYVVVILTEWARDRTRRRSKTIASISRAIFEQLTSEDAASEAVEAVDA